MTEENNSEEKKKNGVDHLSDHLANERTLLAWARTGVAVFALGCAVTRLGSSNGTFLTLTSSNGEKKPIIAGLILAIYGLISILYGVWRYFRTYQIIKGQRFSRSLFTEPTIGIVVLTIALLPILIIFFIV